MVPFPEDEIKTIKRLEVALRNSDFKLLKEGAYKLHEKYHSNHHFEYVELLKEILGEVQINYAIPSDIKNILIPTIQDILDNNDNMNALNTNRVSGLTSLSYDITNNQPKNNQEQYKEQSFNSFEQEPKEEKEYIKPFQEFTSPKPVEMMTNSVNKEDTIINKAINDNQDLQSIASSYNYQPVEDFVTETPILRQQNIFEIPSDTKQEDLSVYDNPEQNEPEKEETPSYDDDFEKYAKEISDEFKEEEKEDYKEEQNTQSYDDNLEEAYETSPQEEFEEIEEIEKEVEEEYYSAEEEPQETIEEPKEEIQEVQEEEQEEFEEPMEEIQEVQEEPKEEVTEEVREKKSIALFFGQESSNEKVRNILKYRELVQSEENITLDEIVSLINEIKTQSDTNVSEILTFLEQLKPTPHNINLITNSQSAHLIDLLIKNEITYSIFNPSNEKRINILPIFGLTNLYKCMECDSEYLDTNDTINPFVLQCPKCKKAMVADLYSSKGEINLDYYNSAIIALANSDTWLLIRPSLTEKLTLNMIRSAMKVSSKVKEVYILDKNINTAETYKKYFADINPDVKVTGDLNTVENFLKSI